MEEVSMTMSKTPPDFIIVGAMKCGTTTLASQLRAQPGIFMTTPKEPNFFSDDAVFAQGQSWYEQLFANAAPGDICGEASTHYTKLPTLPQALPRLLATGARPKIIYMIRNPVERAVSQYIHEWSTGKMGHDISAAFDNHPRLIDYSRYGFQIAPWVEAFGAGAVHLASLEEMERTPQQVLEQVCAFLGLEASPIWKEERARVNVSAERFRRLPLDGLLFANPVAIALRRALVPQALRDRIKRSRQIHDRPQLPPDRVRALQAVFAEDRAILARMFPGHPALTASYPFLGAP